MQSLVRLCKALGHDNGAVRSSLIRSLRLGSSAQVELHLSPCRLTPAAGSLKGSGKKHNTFNAFENIHIIVAKIPYPWAVCQYNFLSQFFKLCIGAEFCRLWTRTRCCISLWTGMIGALPSNPPNSTLSTHAFASAGITRTAVVLQ
jgi:hypothetical protein